MFCYQCEQTTRSENGDGCGSLAVGVCGKDASKSDLQDLLAYAIKGIAQYAKRARELGKTDQSADAFILYGLFTTLTNVNFNAGKFVRLIHQATEHRERVKSLYEITAKEQGLTPKALTGPAIWELAQTAPELQLQAQLAAIDNDRDSIGDEDQEIYAGIEKSLDFLADDPTDASQLLAANLEVGSINLKVMEVLDAAMI